MYKIECFQYFAATMQEMAAPVSYVTLKQLLRYLKIDVLLLHTLETLK